MLILVNNQIQTQILSYTHCSAQQPNSQSRWCTLSIRTWYCMVLKILKILKNIDKYWQNIENHWVKNTESTHCPIHNPGDAFYQSGRSCVIYQSLVQCRCDNIHSTVGFLAFLWGPHVLDIMESMDQSLSKYIGTSRGFVYAYWSDAKGRGDRKYSKSTAQSLF